MPHPSHSSSNRCRSSSHVDSYSLNDSGVSYDDHGHDYDHAHVHCHNRDTSHRPHSSFHVHDGCSRNSNLRASDACVSSPCASRACAPRRSLLWHPQRHPQRCQVNHHRLCGLESLRLRRRVTWRRGLAHRQVQPLLRGRIPVLGGRRDRLEDRWLRDPRHRLQVEESV